eukprot:364516-Chlamydomonas_euryale.AAC.23
MRKCGVWRVSQKAACHVVRKCGVWRVSQKAACHVVRKCGVWRVRNTHIGVDRGLGHMPVMAEKARTPPKQQTPKPHTLNPDSHITLSPPALRARKETKT